ncbi:hypothetical protein PIB30_027498 [Stylosanthes scabra]|uniref:Myb/SANT-like domain-containing protein n=1 Tax=Stylosanthes scabra TaxID=79078 RepID=A0ABU6RAZ5_9FABA|nr:hypothetical protein [Stylosanthes scabra]
MDSNPEEDMPLEEEHMPIGEEYNAVAQGQDGMIDNVEETESFVDFIKELVTEGRRADAGQFKPSSFEKLAAKMNEKYPSVDFQISHCKNKFKRLKEKFQFAADMAASSGFRWDDVK